MLLIDDSPLVLTILSRIINADKRLEVVATTTSPRDCLSLIDKQKPDIICTDYHMPGMSGLDLIKMVMNHKPTPILVVSISVQEDQTENIFQLLEAGAIDVFPKPRASTRLIESEAKALCDRIYVVSKVHVFRSHSRAVQNKNPTAPPRFKKTNSNKFDLILIGGSTGAPQVFHTLFSQLNSQFSIPIIAVQHISEGFTQSFVDWLDRSSSLTIKIAEDGEMITPGFVYFPPDRTHIIIENGRVRLDNILPPNNSCRPSVNVMFESVKNKEDTQKTLAILLTGMGYDGAQGMSYLHNNGAYTVIQSEESCAVFGMPKQALELNAVDQILAPTQILDLMNNLT